MIFLSAAAFLFCLALLVHYATWARQLLDGSQIIKNRFKKLDKAISRMLWAAAGLLLSVTAFIISLTIA